MGMVRDVEGFVGWTLVGMSLAIFAVSSFAITNHLMLSLWDAGTARAGSMRGNSRKQS
jgi:hypothetical protein